MFWKDSFTIIHGSHQFFKNPNRLQEFRLIESVVRNNGHVLMTVPNYDLDMGSNDTVQVGSGANKLLQRRSRKRPVEARMQLAERTSILVNRNDDAQRGDHSAEYAAAIA